MIPLYHHGPPYLSNDAYNIFVGCIVSEILTKNLHLDKFVVKYAQSAVPRNTNIHKTVCMSPYAYDKQCCW